MYDLIDQPTGMLSQTDRFLLWAMRGWQDARRRGISPPVALSRAFASLGIRPVLEHFHVAMTLLMAGDHFDDGIAALNAPHITDAEAVLLKLWTDRGEGKAQKVRETLGLLVSERLALPISAAMAATLHQLHQSPQLAVQVANMP